MVNPVGYLGLLIDLNCRGRGLLRPMGQLQNPPFNMQSHPLERTPAFLAFREMYVKEYPAEFNILENVKMQCSTGEAEPCVLEMFPPLC
ncbi:hypothetical protein [Geopsychrobacter electrodiphilus]|uniref:hypothetical protein n=1 Tax=Geopsychrobacter electrodiphilus TaxID=225196 RepID=UPI000375A984|nr:hypothetical protein [Geopsychrobacter electrodiphilus]